MSRRLRAHPRLLAFAAAAVLAVALLGVAAARSLTPGGCATPPPRPALPQPLRALGDFDQPYSGGDLAAVSDAARRAAAALHPDLAGGTTVRTGDPVTVRAAVASGNDALVVPLLGGGGAPGGTGTAVWGLVAFLRDCAGQLYYSSTVDLYRSGAPPTAFPTVSRARAAAELGAADPELVHHGDPLEPLWRDPRSGRTVPATALASPAVAPTPPA